MEPFTARRPLAAGYTRRQPRDPPTALPPAAWVTQDSKLLELHRPAAVAYATDLLPCRAFAVLCRKRPRRRGCSARHHERRNPPAPGPRGARRRRGRRPFGIAPRMLLGNPHSARS